jgi:hypothetical protein
VAVCHELKGGKISEYDEISLFLILYFDSSLDFTEIQKEFSAAIEGISAEMHQNNISLQAPQSRNEGLTIPTVQGNPNIPCRPLRNVETTAVDISLQTKTRPVLWIRETAE